jgi:hypothetical protein
MLATAIAEPMTLFDHASVRLKLGITLPTMSWIMKRATRVPASTVVRINSASNRIAKWYQMPIMVCPPNIPERMVAMPTANVGAPPVRDSRVFSPTSWAIWLIRSGVTLKPQPEITCAALAAVEPISPAGLFIAK